MIRSAFAFAKAHWDTIAKVVPVMALVAAGIWSVYLFLATGSGMKAVELHVNADLYPYAQDRQLLIVGVKAKNVGKVPVHLSEKGTTIRVFALPENRPPGDIDPSDVPATYVSEIKPDAPFPPMPAGFTLSGVRAYVVKSGGHYIVSARLWVTDSMWLSDSAAAKPPKPEPEPDDRDCDS